MFKLRAPQSQRARIELALVVLPLLGLLLVSGLLAYYYFIFIRSPYFLTLEPAPTQLADYQKDKVRVQLPPLRESILTEAKADLAMRTPTPTLVLGTPLATSTPIATRVARTPTLNVGIVTDLPTVENGTPTSESGGSTTEPTELGLPTVELPELPTVIVLSPIASVVNSVVPLPSSIIRLSATPTPRPTVASTPLLPTATQTPVLFTATSIIPIRPPTATPIPVTPEPTDTFPPPPPSDTDTPLPPPPDTPVPPTDIPLPLPTDIPPLPTDVPLPPTDAPPAPTDSPGLPTRPPTVVPPLKGND